MGAGRVEGEEKESLHAIWQFHNWKSYEFLEFGYEWSTKL